MLKTWLWSPSLLDPRQISLCLAGKSLCPQACCDSADLLITRQVMSFICYHYYYYIVCPFHLVLLNSCFVSTHQAITLLFSQNLDQTISETWPGPESEFEESMVPFGRDMILGFSRKQELILILLRNTYKKILLTNNFFSSFWFLVEFKKCLWFCPLNNLPKSLGRISLVDGEKWFEGSLLY